jgi:NADPH2:quinone reductase
MSESTHAAFIEQPGPASAIRFGELPLPALQAHDVRVRVVAVAVDHVDTYVRSGAYPVEMPLPFVIGRDMVGTVEAVGERVTHVRPGQTVWSNCLGLDGLQGTFAERIVAPEGRLFVLPPGLDAVSSVAVLHSALTAVIGLFDKARLAAGDTLFVNGGSSSVGLAVLQIAKAVGARVGVTAGSDEKAAWCRASGADLVVNYRQQSVSDAIHRFAPGGLDVYWEATPAVDFERVVPLMAPHGRLVVIAGRDAPSPLPVRPFYLRNCSLHGFTVSGTSLSDLQRCGRQINGWLARGVLKAHVQAVLPLAQAAQAHRMQEAGGLEGKLVLTPQG